MRVADEDLRASIIAPVKLSDFDYALPQGLIAQFPPAERGSSRLLHLDGVSGLLANQHFRELPEILEAGDVRVMNDTRVINARLTGHKQSGGQIEVLIERVLDSADARVLAQVRASKSPRIGMRLLLKGGAEAEVLGRAGEFYELRFHDCPDIYALIERAGSVPLPPYISHQADAADATRYQTVYAKTPGAVAAPTAGLHFDAAMLAALQARGVTLAWLTLHVGAGTFQPVRVENLAEHQMHSEWYSLPQSTVDAIATARAAGRHADSSARSGGNAGIHAGGHLRHGEGDESTRA